MTTFSSSSFTSKYLLASIDPLSISIKNAQEKKISDSREFFEQLVSDYPTCGRFWKIYIEQELKAHNYDRVEKLFQRSILKVLNIDLWKCYLNYVRDIKSKMPNHKEKTAQAYDFALDKIGIDVSSYSIWVDYINFLKSIEAAGSFAENQKITAIRKVYQKGVLNPMINVDQLWKDYCNFENQISPLIAKRMIDDRSREFMAVRKIAKEYENVTRYLDRNSPCLAPQGSSEELKQKSYWKKYIEWEKSNPMKSEDIGVVSKRVVYAYEQCLLQMASHPDVYFEATLYLQQMSSIMAEKCDAVMSRHYASEAVKLYERAISSFMKHNPLIYFCYCDYEENRLNYSRVSEIYNKFIELPDIDPSLCYIQYMRYLRRVEGIRAARAVFKKARQDPRTTYHVFVNAAFMEYFCTKDKTIAQKIFEVGMKRFGHVPEFTLAYLQLLRYINDDESTRQSIQSILESNQIPKDKSSQIWSEWQQLENYMGDIESIWKVIEKRQQLDGMAMSEERQAGMLIDRFKFMDLYPCSIEDLRALGYHVPASLDTTSTSNTAASNNTSSIKSNLASSIDSAANALSSISKNSSSGRQQVDETVDSVNPFNRNKITRPRLPSPDMNKLTAFKPVKNALCNLQPVPGGGPLLLPAAFADFVKRLPPPHYFTGPFVAIDEFLSLFQTMDLPEDFDAYRRKYLKTDEEIAEEEQAAKNNINERVDEENEEEESDSDDDEEESEDETAVTKIQAKKLKS